MNWARNHKISLFLSFWMLWSTVGIKLYLEYCACHEAIQASLFKPDEASCPTGVFVVAAFEESEDADHEHACCKSEPASPPSNASCCSIQENIPGCPPEGCDSQDVQEYRVTNPYLLSGQDWPEFSVALTGWSPLLLDQEYLPFQDQPVVVPFHPSPHPTGREFRIRFQSFLC